MKKSILFLALFGFSLSACSKTNLLYEENKYNSPVFDENYYTDWDGVDKLNTVPGLVDGYKSLMSQGEEAINLTNGSINYNSENYVWNGDNESQFGYHNNLSNVEKKFSYGVTSKLFDGRVRCDGLYQKSRVQIDKSGFAMKFPKQLVSAKFLGFAVRGGTDFPQGQEFSNSNLKVNFVWSFFVVTNEPNVYQKVVYNLNDVAIPVDMGGATNFVHFLPLLGEDFSELNGAVAMSFTWSCNDERLAARNVTDDYTQKEKNHLALMLYEVFIGQSTWY